MLQPICGYVLDVVGLKRGMALFATAWSAINMAHAFASSWPAFAVLRGLLGLAEGSANPAGMKATAEWFPASERGLAGKVKLITTDLFAEMSPYLQKGTITASIYQQPHRQGQIAVRLATDHLTNKTAFPAKVHLSPGVVMSTNLHLFREMRQPDSRLETLPSFERNGE